MNKLTQEQFKKDFNSSECILSNEQLRIKYKFETNQEMFNYTHDNNLIIVKEKTTEEEKSLSLMANKLKECMDLLR